MYNDLKKLNAPYFETKNTDIKESRKIDIKARNESGKKYLNKS